MTKLSKNLLGAAFVCCLLYSNLFPTAVAKEGNFLSIQKKNKNDKLDAQSVQQLADASTGTITTTEPGKDREPTTCNEIMAKAVVVAGQEKTDALQMRDEALAETAKLTDKVEFLNKQVQDSTAEAKKTVIELEAMKLTMERLLSDEKDRSKKALDDKDAANEVIVNGIKNDMEALKKTLNQQMDEVKLDAKKQVEVADEEAKKRIAAMEEEMEVAKVEAEKEIEATKNQSQLAIAAGDDDAKKRIAAMEEEMEAAKVQAKEEIQATKDQSQKEIESIDVNAKKQIASMKEEMEATKLEAEKKIETTNIQTQKKIESMLADFKTQKEEIQKEASDNIETIKTDTQKEIKAMEKQVEDVKTEMKLLKESNKEEIKRITTENDEKLNNVIHEAHKQETEVYGKMEKHEDEMKKEMDAIKKDAEIVVADTLRTAEAEYKRLTEKSEKDIKRVLDEMEKTVKEKDAELEKNQHEADKKEKEMQSTIHTLNKEWKASNDTSFSLDSKLSNTVKELAYWKEVGSNPVYVNMTLIWDDFSFTASRLAKETKIQVQDSLDVVVFETEKFMRPYVEQLKEIYDDKCKEFVDKHIVPVVDKTTEKFNEHISPQLQNLQTLATKNLEKLQAKSEILQGKIFSSLCHKVETYVGVILHYVEGSATIYEKMPRSIILALENTEDDASNAVRVGLKITAIFVIYVMKYVILFFVWYFVKLPFRIFWFFCPLRLLFRKSKTKEGAKSSMSDDGDEIAPYMVGSSSTDAVKDMLGEYKTI